MANKFHIQASIGEPADIAVYTYPVFTNIGGTTPISGEGTAYGAWTIGSILYNTSTDDPLSPGYYTVIISGLLTVKIISGGEIESFGFPSTNDLAYYNNCADVFSDTNTQFYYYYFNTLENKNIYCTNEFCVDSDRLDGLYMLYPHTTQFTNGALVATNRNCPWDTIAYASCADAAGFIGGTAVYSLTDPADWEVGTRIHDTPALTTVYGDQYFFIYVAGGATYYVTTDETGYISLIGQCYLSDSITTYDNYQDYFLATDEVFRYVSQGDLLIEGTRVYTDENLSVTFNGAFVFENKTYICSGLGDIVSIIDYELTAYTSSDGLYADCSSSPWETPLYLQNFSIGSHVYTSVNSIYIADFSPASYISFVYASNQYNTAGNGQIVNILPCSS